MYMDKKGQLITYSEIGGMSIDEFKIDIENTDTVMDRLDKLFRSLEETDECKQLYNKLNEYYDDIRQYLPENRKNFYIMRIDENILELLILYEEHFYKHGYNDGKKHASMLNEFLSRLKKGQVD